MACQIDYLCQLPDNRERCLALECLPPDLKSTYERILRRVDETNIHVRALVQRTLRWLVVAKGRLTIGALREALSIKDGTQKLDRDAVPEEFVLLRACSSLVRKSTSGQELELAHFTVKEFLLGIDRDSDFSAYRVNVEQSEVELGKACLTHLTLQDFDSGVSWSREAPLKRYQEYAFRHYAVQHWRSHAKGHLGHADILALTKKLLDPSKPGSFTTWTQDHQYMWGFMFRGDEARLPPPSSMIDYQSAYSAPVTDTQLHYASALALPEVCKWLLDCGCKVNLISRFGSPLNHALGGHSSLVSRDLDARRCRRVRDKEPLIKVIEILLEAGADPNCKSSGEYPLHYAFGDYDIILRLLQKGARYTIENAYRLLDPALNAELILRKIGRENFHEDDYAFLLRKKAEEPPVDVDYAAQYLGESVFSQVELRSLNLHPYPG